MCRYEARKQKVHIDWTIYVVFVLLWKYSRHYEALKSPLPSKSCGNYLGKWGEIPRLGFTLMEIMHRKALCILGGFHNTLQRMSSLTSQSFLTQLKEPALLDEMH